MRAVVSSDLLRRSADIERELHLNPSEPLISLYPLLADVSPAGRHCDAEGPSLCSCGRKEQALVWLHWAPPGPTPPATPQSSAHNTLYRSLTARQPGPRPKELSLSNCRGKCASYFCSLALLRLRLSFAKSDPPNQTSLRATAPCITSLPALPDSCLGIVLYALLNAHLPWIGRENRLGQTVVLVPAHVIWLFGGQMDFMTTESRIDGGSGSRSRSRSKATASGYI